jgi:hypothetical protein
MKPQPVWIETGFLWVKQPVFKLVIHSNSPPLLSLNWQGLVITSD